MPKTRSKNPLIPGTGRGRTFRCMFGLVEFTCASDSWGDCRVPCDMAGGLFRILKGDRQSGEGRDPWQEKMDII